jgi:coenzyme F420 hydrogenase subunit beta
MANRGLIGLQESVLERELCTLCGACLSLCPYLGSHEGRVVKLHDCDLAEGRCFAYCPRTELDPGALERAVFGPDADSAVEVGHVAHVLMARATGSFRDRAQNGGTVTALMIQALRDGLINAALLTRRDEQQLPQSLLARTEDAILSCAGSSYVAGATLEALATLDETDRAGVVALPCQAQALPKMRGNGEPADPVNKVNLVIGLFCTWALARAPFGRFLQERFGDRAVRKIDISPPPGRLLVVTTDRGDETVPLDEIRPLIRPGCAACVDLTAELADVSVGSVESQPGWNTVLVRSEAGEALLRSAREAGTLELRELPRADMEHLWAASLEKKRRALAALSGSDGSYLAPEWVRRVMEARP